MSALQVPFHLAFPVEDLASTRSFYGGVLGLREGRAAEAWIDYDFYGHQISAHVAPGAARAPQVHRVDVDPVPVRHFGAVLEWGAWEALAARIQRAGIPFLIEPHVRFRGEIGEQGTFFVQDPSGNSLEFKTFRDSARLFAR